MSSPNEKINEFFGKIDELPEKDRIQFRRGCGLMLRDAGAELLMLFYHVLPHDIEWGEDRWFTAACIHCLWKAEEKNRLPMEKAIARLKSNDEISDSFEHRLIALMDTAWSEDGYLNDKLVRMAKMLKQKDYAVDGGALLESLLKWNSEYRSVQKQWAKAYCNTDKLIENTEE